MIGFLAGNDGTATNPDIRTSAGLMSATGRNTGNLAFWYTTRRLIDEDAVMISWKLKELPKNLKAFVIPAANFIGTHSNLAPITRIIRELNVPCVIVGLGAQSDREDQVPNVGDSVKEFLHEISARTPYLCVRGEYTAAVCHALGVKNVKVLGCPSILMNPDRTLGSTMEQRIADLTPDNVAVHAACLKGNLTGVERELLRFVLLNRGSSYVIQRPPELITILYREKLKEAEAKYVAEFARFLNLTVEELTRFVIENGHVPTSIDSWQAYIRRFSCSVNTRIHGTVVSFQAGVPSLCVMHDTRTRELASGMELPRLEIAQFIEHRYDVKRMFNAAGFVGAKFESNRSHVAQQYLHLFNEIGLKPSPHLKAFVN